MSGPEPTIWLLLGANAGDNAQARVLAEALDRPVATKQLHWRHPPIERVRSALLPGWAAGPVRLDPHRSSALAPPWPDLVIAAELLTSRVAAWIRRASGGRTRIVRIGNPRGPLCDLDLMIAPPQFAVPPRANVLHVGAPLVRLDRERLRRAAEALRPWLAGLPRPWLGVLVGGPSAEFRFGPDDARRLAAALDALARKTGATPLVVASRRTPPRVAAALREALHSPHRFAPLAEAGGDDYGAALALADALVVTGDSASMLTEACATGRPVHIFPLPPRRFRIHALRRPAALRLARAAGGSPGWSAVQDALHAHGLVRYDRDLRRLHRLLIARGAARMLDPTAELAFVPPSPDWMAADFAAAVGRIAGMLGPKQD